MSGSGKQRVSVTGHNRESSGRVVHYLRSVGATNNGSALEFHSGVIVTDEKSIIADGTEFDVKVSFKAAK